MESQSFFLQLLAILITALIFGEVAARFRIPSVIGELLAGVVLGPSLLGRANPDIPASCGNRYYPFVV